MRAEIRDPQRRLAITTMYVTHDQDEAMAVSDRITVMNQGTIVQLGTAQDLYHRPVSMFAVGDRLKLVLRPESIERGNRDRAQDE